MKRINDSISAGNAFICNNISLLRDTNRGLLSQNILGHLRDFIEHISLRIYSDSIKQELEVTYINIQKANKHIKSHAHYKFIADFHKFVSISASHYIQEPEISERLMLKYYEYLLKLKMFMKEEYGMEILENINDFPINQDPHLTEYYTKIAEQLNLNPTGTNIKYLERYYIQKIKPFFIDQHIYYEITFTTAIDNTSKFDRHIAFSKHEILPNYAVKLELRDSQIHVLGKTMPIQIIDSWEVSIRPCEIRNFSKIFGYNTNFSTSNEMLNIMNILKQDKINLVELIDLPQTLFNHYKERIAVRTKKLHFWPILESCRTRCKTKSAGSNIIRYLLYKFNNKIIKDQYWNEDNSILSNLYLKSGCKPFDDMPFVSSPIGHNPKFRDILYCIDSTGRECELLARKVKNNTETHGILYTPLKDLPFENIPELIDQYNSKLYYKHRPRRELCTYKNHLFINEYESDCQEILFNLKKYTTNGISNYTNSVEQWFRNSIHAKIDCEEKIKAIRGMFANSHIALIYGAAGTGKTTLINYISNYFSDKDKLYLANTNPAVDNLKRKVHAPKTSFMTIAKFLSNWRHINCDILIIDECSTVSNSDMNRLLKAVEPKVIILVGDIFQIEAINFGNWFFLAQHALPKYTITELTTPFRTNNDNLITLWNKARKVDDNLLEHITTNHYSSTLNSSIFEYDEEDSIVLCLNYDGLYGINNLNRFLQNGNPSYPVHWGIERYKVGDPVLFNESNRFYPALYNNLKGKITNISSTIDEITFDIEVFDASIDGIDAEMCGFEIVGLSPNNNTIIRFSTNRLKSTDEDENSNDTIVPFQVAYAISIHKAQGLEYKSVKIVITHEVEEHITHNIFYTAITRAKEHLTIYWTPETESKILNSLKPKFNKKDWGIIKSRYPGL